VSFIVCFNRFCYRDKKVVGVFDVFGVASVPEQMVRLLYSYGKAAGMMWSWSAGYKFVAFEGTLHRLRDNCSTV
jgi:hypothetical protein